MYAPGPGPDAYGIPPLEGMDPGEWIRTVWGNYLELWPKILGLQHEAAQLAATSTGTTHTVARAIVDAAGQLSRIHTSTVRKVEEYSGYLGLGAVGVTTAALAVAALALIVLWCFRRYDALDAAFEAIRDGSVTPQQATELMDAAGPLPDVGVLGGLSLGLVLGIGAVAGLLYLASKARLSGGLRSLGSRAENPDLVILGMNPDPVWSHRVLQLDYVHDDNSQPYTHSFRPGVQMQALEDGSVRLFHPRRRIWRDFT